MTAFLYLIVLPTLIILAAVQVLSKAVEVLIPLAFM